MPQESYDLKRRASEQLKGQWLQAGIVVFYCLATYNSVYRSECGTFHPNCLAEWGTCYDSNDYFLY